MSNGLLPNMKDTYGIEIETDMYDQMYNKAKNGDFSFFYCFDHIFCAFDNRQCSMHTMCCPQFWSLGNIFVSNKECAGYGQRLGQEKH